MADLGVIPSVRTLVEVPRFPVTNYSVQRGNDLGAIGIRVLPERVERVAPLTGYIVRQTRILFRQLWPSHGQRFPQ